METNQPLTHLRDLIARDELPAALQQLRNLLDNSPKLDEAIIQSGRFEAIRRQMRLGLVSPAEANLTQNEIRAGLLDLVREIEENTALTSIRPDAAELREEILKSISIVNSKNVVTGNISAGGNVIIGDNNSINQ